MIFVRTKSFITSKVSQYDNCNMYYFVIYFEFILILNICAHFFIYCLSVIIKSLNDNSRGSRMIESDWEKGGV